MSLEPTEPSNGGEQRAGTERSPVLSAESPLAQGSGDRRPTFSAPASGPAESLAPAGTERTAALRRATKTATSGVTSSTDMTGTPDVPGSADADGAASAGERVPDGTAGSARADVAGADGPLLGDTVRLRSGWDRVQAGFVDDPEEAVADAAELVERTVQALIGALRQRQRTLRELARRGPADGHGAVGADPAGAAGAAAGGKGAGRNGAPDTEHLRQMMLRYRALFNQVCRP